MSTFIYYSQYEDRIKRSMGRDDSKTLAIAMDNFNMVQQFLANNEEWKSLSTTASLNVYSGTYYLSLAEEYMTDVDHFYSLKLHDGTRYWSPLSYITPMKWDAEVSGNIHNITGKPARFTEYNDYIYFDKMFDDDYTLEIRYQFVPNHIWTNLDEVDLRGECDDALIALTICLTWVALEEPENAKIWMDIAKGFIRKDRMDLNTLLNFRTSSKSTERSTTGEYWNDPFINRSPR